MQSKIQSKYLACSTLALIGFAAAGCSTSGTQAVEAIQPDLTGHTDHIVYDDQSPQRFSLVATDYAGFIAFADTMAAWSIEEPDSTKYENLAVVE